jgi:hypothetical protein
MSRYGNPLWIQVLGLGLYSDIPQWVAAVIGAMLVLDLPAFMIGLLGGLNAPTSVTITTAVASPIIVFCFSRLAMKELAVEGQIILARPIWTITTIIEAWALAMASTYLVTLIAQEAHLWFGAWINLLIYGVLTAWTIRILWLAKRAT